MPVKSAPNCTVTYNSVNITQYLNTATLEAVIEEIETSNLASTGAETTPGLAKWSVKGGGDWAKALDDAVAPDAVSPPGTLRTLVVTIGASGAVATYTWTTNAYIGNYSVALDAKANIKWTGTIAVNGAPVRS